MCISFTRYASHRKQKIRKNADIKTQGSNLRWRFQIYCLKSVIDLGVGLDYTYSGISGRWDAPPNPERTKP